MTKKISSLPLQAALLYIAIGCLWIFLSDTILALLTSDQKVLTTIQTYKGFLFVTVTASILFFMLKQRLNTIEKERMNRMQSDHRLSESEKRFFKYFNSNPVAVVITRKSDGIIVDANQSYQSLLGYTRQEFLGNTETALAIIPSAEEWEKNIERLNAFGSIRNNDTVLRTKSGRLISVQTSIEQIEIEGEPCLLSSYRDVTDRKLAEAEIFKLNRINRVLTNINQLIVRTKNIEKVFQEACSIAVEDGKFKMAWIGMKNDTTNVLDVVAHAGVSEDYLQKIDIDFNSKKRSSGPTGLTVTTGIHHYVADIETDPSMSPWRKDALRIGYRSSAAFPLIVRGNVVGSFTLYAGEINFFTTEELELLDELAMDISFAMEVNEADKQRQEDHNALHESATMLQTILESTADGILTVNNKGKIIKTNKRFAELWQIPPGILTSGDDEVLLNFVIDQLINPVQFLDKVHHLYQSPNKDLDVLKFKDGRIFERFSTPLIVDDTIAGRVWSFRDITERKHAEEKLYESEERYRSIVENVRHAYYEVNGRSLFTYCNPGLCIISGYAEEELLGTSPFRLIAEEDRARIIAQYREWDSEKRKDISIEFLVQKKNGEKFWVEQITHCQYNEQGKLISATNFLRDIEERKEAEKTLQLRESYLTAIIENQPGMIWLKDVNSGFLAVNQRFADACGKVYPAELIGKSDTDIWPTELAKKYIDDDAKVIKGKIPVVVEEPIVDGGTTSWFETFKTPILDKKGNVLGTTGYSRNITERKKAEKQIEMLAHALRSISECVSVTDLNDVIFFVNEAFCKTYGYEAQEVIGKHISILRSPKNNPATTSEILEKTLKNGWHGELLNRRKNGEEFFIELSTRVIRNDQGENIALIGVSMDITERKKTIELLRENEERLRLSLNAANQGLYDLNIQTENIIVNEEYTKLLGYDSAAFVETISSWMERVHPDDKERISQSYHDYIAGTLNDYQVEYRQRIKSGEWKWFLSIGKIIDFTPEGKPLRMVGTHTDIDRLKRSEEKMLLLSTALEAAANGIVITDLDGHIVWTNDAVSKITGYSAQELIGGKPNMLKSGKQSQEFYAHLWKTITAGSIWRGNIINKRKDGTLYDDEMTITPVRNAHGTISHFVAVKQDVTERNKTIQKIKEQAMFLDEAHEGIIVRDLNYSVLYWNKGAEKIFGWKAEEAVGKDIRSLIYQGRNDLKKELNQLFQDQSYLGEINLRTKENKKIIVAARLNIINDADGKPKAVLSMTNDITEKKRLESQFLRTQRMESLGTLAGGIAHDLNNVLSPIMLSVELLKRNYVNESSQKILESVESSAHRGSEIVKQILAFARGMENQKMLIQPRHVVKEVVGILKETFPRSINIVSDIPNAVWTIIGDPTHFHQLIMNISLNARDAMPDGGTLSITASNEVIDEQYVRMNMDAKVGRYVMFSVKDTGFGMSSHILDHLFEPFFTTKSVGKGTGLGLSTVYTIVKSHNGFIKVQSEPGKGTIFNIYLPASESTIIELDEKSATEDFFGKGELILLVDDEKSIRDVTKHTLEAYNYSVITASDGAEGAAKFADQRETISLVITDMMMPVMDGHHLITALRKMNPTIKIIASSGLVSMKNKITESDKYGLSGFIQKPYTAEKLMSVVSAVMHGKKIL